MKLTSFHDWKLLIRWCSSYWLCPIRRAVPAVGLFSDRGAAQSEVGGCPSREESVRSGREESVCSGREESVCSGREAGNPLDGADARPCADSVAERREKLPRDRVLQQ